MTEQQLQQIRIGELWIENDLAKPGDTASLKRLKQALQVVWPTDDWSPEGKPFYARHTQDTWQGIKDVEASKPTIKASELLQDFTTEPSIQLYPL
jgi:hypothetical protein